MSRRGRASGRRARYLLAVNNARPHESIYTSVFDDGQTRAGINLSACGVLSLSSGRKEESTSFSLSLSPPSIVPGNRLDIERRARRVKRKDVASIYLILLSRVDGTIFFPQRKNSRRGEEITKNCCYRIIVGMDEVREETLRFE